MNDPEAEQGAGADGVGDDVAGVPPSGSDAPAECDIVLEGGAASGVVYPRALTAMARRYRLRGIGGTSAGAMAAAVAAGAEHGRATGRGGYDTVEAVPDELAGGGLGHLFQPAARTRPLFRLMLALTGGDRPDGRTLPSRVAAAARAVLTGYPWVMIAAALPGLAGIVIGIVWAGGWAIALGAVLLVVLIMVAAAVAPIRGLTRDIPANGFGMCSGLAVGDRHPALTEWLSHKINTSAGLAANAPPLTFGQLWTAGSSGGDAAVGTAFEDPHERRIDLRVITTNLSEARPYELPFDGSWFFYDPAEWRRLFPPEVMDALEATANPSTPIDDDPDAWKLDHDAADRHVPRLRRLPDADQVPVVVAARMSLSMPLVISAIPLWTVRRREPRTGDTHLDPTGRREYVKVWFSDGGVTSNFPVQLFDTPLPTRPTFAINLRDFAARTRRSSDEAANIQWAHGNRDGVQPEIARWPEQGWSAVAGFGAAIFESASSWYDNTRLTFPGFRDRIVRVLQTAREGGLNLAMADDVIERLAERGKEAAEAVMDEFEDPHYPPLDHNEPTSTGWDNHRWIRYRALLSVLPHWAREYDRGRRVLDSNLIADPPSLPFTSCRERQLAEQLDAGMQHLAAIVDDADSDALAAITSRPRPVGAIRRVPHL